MAATPMHKTEADELLRADVEQSRAQLAQSLRQVSRSGQHVLQRVQAQLKPGLLVAAAVVGVVAVTGVAIALTRGQKRRGWSVPQEPSALGVAAKAVGLWALRMAARSVAQALVARLEQPVAAADASAPTAAQ